MYSITQVHVCSFWPWAVISYCYCEDVHLVFSYMKLQLTACTHKTPPWTSCACMCCTRLLRCISVWSALLYLCLFQSVSSNEWPLNLWIAYRKLTKPTASQQCDHCLVCRVGVELQHQRSSWYTFFNQHNQVWVDKVSDEMGSYLLVIPMVQQCTMYVCHLATLATWPKCILVLCRYDIPHEKSYCTLQCISFTRYCLSYNWVMHDFLVYKPLVLSIWTGSYMYV